MNLTVPARHARFNSHGFFVKGCLIFLAVLAVLIGALLIWLITAGKDVVSNALREEIVNQVETSDLPEGQKDQLIAEINRVTDGFQEGDISLKQVTLIIEQLEESPAMTVLTVLTADGDPIAESDLSAEEKEAAEQTIDRFVYGVFEDRIPASAIDELINPLLDRDATNDGWQFRSDISDEELRSALAKAKRYADDANIRDANLTPDVAREVREIIDRILSAQE